MIFDESAILQLGVVFNRNRAALAKFTKAREPRSFYRIENAKKDSADVYLYDDIGNSWDGVTAKSFADDMRAIGDVGTLNIYINSPGGSVFDGTAIYNQLVRLKAKKIVNIDGVAASIASVVAMAGDVIKIAANGFMMIHDPWAMAVGTAEEFRKMAETLDMIRNSIAATYVERTEADLEKIIDLMAKETWFTAEQAVELGLADEITNAVEVANLSRHDLTGFSSVPDWIARAVAPATESPAAEPATPPTPHQALATVAARLAKRGLTLPA